MVRGHKTLRSKAQRSLELFLKSARKEAGLTQMEVAQAMGWPQSDLSRVENGERRLDVVEFVRLAQVIGFRPGDAIEILENEIKA